MAIIDLTHQLNKNISIYPGDPPFALCSHSTVPKDGYSVQSLSLGSHTGTHVDAPSHFFASGKSIDQIPLASFVGSARVIDVSPKNARERITWDDVLPHEDSLRPGDVVLFRTNWCAHWGTPSYIDHPFLDRDVAQRLVQLGISRIGIDTLSTDETEGQSGDFGVHEIVLGAGGLLIENLRNLKNVPVDAMISFVPLNLTGGDGSPVRAYAWTREGSDTQNVGVDTSSK
ncbi:putative cyclase [Hymenopellis radicata]|nr:putative cyclase [Hymenopellis radicata]